MNCTPRSLVTTYEYLTELAGELYMRLLPVLATEKNNVRTSTNLLKWSNYIIPKSSMSLTRSKMILEEDDLRVELAQCKHIKNNEFQCVDAN